jgi:hypothetical protein
MLSQTCRSAALARTTGDTEIHRPENVADLERYRERRSASDDRCTSLCIGIDGDGLLTYESHIRCEDADRITDALLLMLIEVREARAKCGATFIGNRGEQ